MVVLSRTDLGCNLTCEEITFEWMRDWFKVPYDDRMFCVLFGGALLAKRRNASKEDFYQWALVHGESFQVPNSETVLHGYLWHLMVNPDERIHRMSPGVSGHYSGVSVPVDRGLQWWKDRCENLPNF